MSPAGSVLRISQGEAAQDRLNYVTRTAEGRTIKSSTMVLRNSAGRVIGALCVNLDITELRLAVGSITSLIGDTQPKSPATTVFADDIAEVIRTVMAHEESRLGRTLRHDTR